MIDLDREHLLTLRQAARRFPGRKRGKTLHVSCLYRWIREGRRGIHLEYITMGGTQYTSVEALQRYADRLSNLDQGALAMDTPLPSRQRQRQIKRAARQVDTILGIHTPSHSPAKRNERDDNASST